MYELGLLELGGLALGSFLLNAVAQELDVGLELEQTEVALYVIVLKRLSFAEAMLVFLDALDSALHAAHTHFKFFLLRSDAHDMLLKLVHLLLQLRFKVRDLLKLSLSLDLALLVVVLGLKVDKGPLDFRIELLV